MCALRREVGDVSQIWVKYECGLKKSDFVFNCGSVAVLM